MYKFIEKNTSGNIRKPGYKVWRNHWFKQRSWSSYQNNINENDIQKIKDNLKDIGNGLIAKLQIGTKSIW